MTPNNDPRVPDPDERPESDEGVEASASAPSGARDDPSAAENQTTDAGQRPDAEPENDGEASGFDDADEIVIEAEGPDVETSLTDADLAFLSDQSSAEQLAAERLTDLQRVTAEYANYRKRTEENREVERERAAGDTVKALLPVLDDLDLAEKHGDLADGGAFATIAGKLRGAMERLGLERVGEAGEVFDHNVHEAIFQQPNPDVDTETIADVVQSGYFLGSTLLRAAKVVVSVPERADGA